MQEVKVYKNKKSEEKISSEVQHQLRALEVFKENKLISEEEYQKMKEKLLQKYRAKLPTENIER